MNRQHRPHVGDEERFDLGGHRGLVADDRGFGDRRFDDRPWNRYDSGSFRCRVEGGRIVDLGVKLQLHTKVTSVVETMRKGRYDAVFLAVGAHIAKRAYLPAGSALRAVVRPDQTTAPLSRRLWT